MDRLRKIFCCDNSHTILDENYTTTTPIRHVVCCMLENRSFDQVFGYRNDYPTPFKVNGINFCDDIDETKRNFNYDMNNNKIYQNPVTAFTGHDESVHDVKATMTMINGINKIENNDKMSGFVLANQLKIKSANDPSETIPALPSEIMGYFPHGQIPVFDFLADNYTLCDNWFASIPSMTLPNRAFALCGQSDNFTTNTSYVSHHLDISKPNLFDCDTIFDRLNDKNLPWKVYYSDVALSLSLQHQLQPENLSNYDTFSQFEKDVKNNTLPAFSFIEPEYGIESSADKIEHVFNGQKLVGNILTSLENNIDLFNDTLVVLYYDECGGFYDHVVPPAAIPPFRTNKKLSEEEYFAYNRYGPRVPALLISPRIEKGVDSTLYDHTSVLAFLERNFDLNPLTDRDTFANSNFKILDIPLQKPSIKPVLKDLKNGHSLSTTIRNRGKSDELFMKQWVELHTMKLSRKTVKEINKIK